jgi:hypothetical protein
MEQMEQMVQMEQREIIKPDISNLQNLSVESLYNYIRFYAFLKVSDSDKKDLFMKMLDVRARDPDVFPKISESLKRDNFVELTNVVMDKNNKVLKEKITASILTRSQKRMEIVIDCYLSESNACTARDLLSYLIFYPNINDNDENLLEFVKQYTSSKPGTRGLLIPNNSGHFFTI